jgi:hypothetical protein
VARFEPVPAKEKPETMNLALTSGMPLSTCSTSRMTFWLSAYDMPSGPCIEMMM